MRAVENVLENLRLVHKLCSISHLHRLSGIRAHSCQPQYDGKIVVRLAWLSIGPVSCFLAVGAFSEVLVRSNKTHAAVDATAVSYRQESSKESNTLFCSFEGVMTRGWECLGKLVEGVIRKVILDFKCISAKQVTV